MRLALTELGWMGRCKLSKAECCTSANPGQCEQYDINQNDTSKLVRLGPNGHLRGSCPFPKKPPHLHPSSLMVFPVLQICSIILYCFVTYSVDSCNNPTTTYLLRQIYVILIFEESRGSISIHVWVKNSINKTQLL